MVQLQKENSLKDAILKVRFPSNGNGKKSSFLLFHLVLKEANESPSSPTSTRILYQPVMPSKIMDSVNVFFYEIEEGSKDFFYLCEYFGEIGRKEIETPKFLLLDSHGLPFFFIFFFLIKKLNLFVSIFRFL